MGMKASGGARKLLRFVSSLEEKGLNCKGLRVRTNEPIRFVCAEDKRRQEKRRVFRETVPD